MITEHHAYIQGDTQTAVLLHRINELEDVLRALLDDDNENTRIRAEMALE
jgi:hypothetical protein